MNSLIEKSSTLRPDVLPHSNGCAAPRRCSSGSRVTQKIGAASAAAPLIDRALRSRIGESHLIFEANPVPMWIYDAASLQFLAVNHAAVHRYGYSCEEFLTMMLGEIRLIDAAVARRNSATSSRENPVISGRCAQRTKAGTVIEVDIASRDFTVSGRLVRMDIVRDVTPRRTTEDDCRRLEAEREVCVRERTVRLETLVREMEEFSYSVSHDLRAPLRGVHGFTRKLLADHRGSLDAEALRLLEAISKESQRMSQLIEDLLVFSQTNFQQPDFAEIDMTALAESVADVLLERNPDARARIKVRPLPPARGDRSMMRQVLSNLMDNAIKYSSRHPSPLIEIDGKRESEWNVYCVRDNGVGFDPRYAQRLFAVFQRAHSQDEFEGTGVGLAIVQRIISRHGGKVWAEGRIGAGAEFYFQLR